MGKVKMKNYQNPHMFCCDRYNVWLRYSLYTMTTEFVLMYKHWFDLNKYCYRRKRRLMRELCSKFPKLHHKSRTCLLFERYFPKNLSSNSRSDNYSCGYDWVVLARLVWQNNRFGFRHSRQSTNTNRTGNYVHLIAAYRQVRIPSRRIADHKIGASRLSNNRHDKSYEQNTILDYWSCNRIYMNYTLLPR